MRQHSAKELRYDATLLSADGTTILTGVGVGVEDLTGRRLEQAQLISSETSHMVLVQYADSTGFPVSGYLLIDGVTYVADYVLDPRTPRPRVWAEVYCHIERSGN